MSRSQLFISHSGANSAAIGKYFYSWIQQILQHIKPWASFDDGDHTQGTNDHLRIISNARNSHFCICILTPESLNNSHWVLFEPGMFYGMNKEVFVLLCDGLTHNELGRVNNPLEGYQTYPTFDSLKKLIKSINKCSITPIEESIFTPLIDNHIRKFIEEYERIFGASPSRSNADSKILADDKLLMSSINKLLS